MAPQTSYEHVAKSGARPQLWWDAPLRSYRLDYGSDCCTACVLRYRFKMLRRACDSCCYQGTPDLTGDISPSTHPSPRLLIVRSYPAAPIVAQPSTMDDTPWDPETLVGVDLYAEGALAGRHVPAGRGPRGM
ncbi:hypothetical protein C2E23DRAFT_884857 [Lenzites betulinus]|nr:hypothetical protein C2E23DRAFT_884857 [Lenzites betulinus]